MSLTSAADQQPDSRTDPDAQQSQRDECAEADECPLEMMAALVGQFVPSQAFGKERSFAHVAGRLRTPRDKSGMDHVPNTADQGEGAEQPEGREKEPDFDVVVHGHSLATA